VPVKTKETTTISSFFITACCFDQISITKWISVSCVQNTPVYATKLNVLLLASLVYLAESRCLPSPLQTFFSTLFFFSTFFVSPFVSRSNLVTCFITRQLLSDICTKLLLIARKRDSAADQKTGNSSPYMGI
jgi:hypothetical protein